MPSRVIRGQINSSRSLNNVSLEADLTFRAIIIACDDFGRMDARPTVLKALLFPCRKSVTEEHIMDWVSELATEGCVQLYSVDENTFMSLPNWEKHRGKSRRGTESKYPQPPADSESAVLKRSDSVPRKSGEVHADPPGCKVVGGKVVGGRCVAAGAPTDTDSTSSRSRPRKPPPAKWARCASAHLIKCLTDVPGARIPKGAETRWAREIELIPGEIPELDRILRVDGEDALYARLEIAIEDCTGPEAMRSKDAETRKYSPQVRCGKSLRKKWAQITAAAARRGPPLKTRDEIIREVAGV